MINAVKTVFAVEKTVPATISYPINDGDILIYDANSGTFINHSPPSNTPVVIPSGTILSNILVSSSVAEPNSLSDILDKTFSNQQGNIIFRGESSWEYITPGGLGTVLSSNGLSTDPSWISTVSSIATNSSLIGGPITTTGTIGINLSNSNTWLAQQNFNGGITQAGNSVSFDKITTVFTNTSLDGTYRTVLVDATNGPVTITVQAISSPVNSRVHNIKKIDSSVNLVNIVVADGSNIDNLSSVVLNTQYQSRTVQASSTQWWLI